MLFQLQHVIKIRIKVNLGVRLNWASIDCFGLSLYIVIFRYWNFNGRIRCLRFYIMGAVTSNRRGEVSPFSWSGSPRRSVASPKRRWLFATCHHVTFQKAWIFVSVWQPQISRKNKTFEEAQLIYQAIRVARQVCQIGNSGMAK